MTYSGWWYNNSRLYTRYITNSNANAGRSQVKKQLNRALLLWCPDKPHPTTSIGLYWLWLSNLESQATIFTLPTCSVVSSFLNCASVKMKVHTLSQNL